MANGVVAFVDGDSGAWVILQDTCELLGHVVATDCLGAAYVMAACHVFLDIQRSQQAIEVSLPTFADVVAIATGKQRATKVADDSSALFSADRFMTRINKANSSYAPSTAKPPSFSNTTSITLDNIPVSTLGIFEARLGEMEGYVSMTSESEGKTCLIVAEFKNYWTASSAIHHTTLLAQSKHIGKFAASFSRGRQLRKEAEQTSRTSDGTNQRDSTVANHEALPIRSVIFEEPKDRSTRKQALYALDDDENNIRKITHDTTLAKEMEDESESDIGLSYKLYQRT